MNVRLDEWSALALLLERGIPLEDALSLAFRDSDPYQKRLRQGESCFIDAGGPRNSFERTLSFFLKAAGMASAIRMSVRLCTIRQRLLRQLFKQASYPIVLLVMAFVLVLFFLSSIFPQLQQLSDTSSSSAALLLLQLLRLLFLLILCLLVLLLALSVFLWRQKDVRRICILRFHSRLPLLQNLISYLFAAYLHELMTAGLSTRQAFAFLEQLEEESMLHSCIIEVRRLLEQGFSYEQIIATSTYFSSRFRRFFLIGHRSSTLPQTLTLFCEQELERWQKQLARGGWILQLCVYAVIAILVFCVYQMLLTPLDMLNQM